MIIFRCLIQKTACLLILLFGVVSNILAQYNCLTVASKPATMIVEQIDYYDNSMVVFLTYYNQGYATCYINDKTYARTADGRRYPLLNSINMPISSEAEPREMIMSSADQCHRFALEFEKAPLGEAFDIIEIENKPSAFNFYGMCADTLCETERLNPDEFIRGYPVKERGLFMQDGMYIQYITYQGITLTVNVSAVQQYGKYYNVDLLLQNASGKSVLFTLDNVEAEGYILAADTIKKTIPLQVFTAYEYDKKVKNRQAWNNFFVALGESLAAENAGYSTSSTTYSGSAHTYGSATAYGSGGYASAHGSSYTTVHGRSQTSTYDGAAAYWAQQQAQVNYSAFADSQSQLREQLNAGYVKSNTIKDGVDYYGYFNIKYNKKIDHLKIRFRIDGEDFVFLF